RVLGLLLVIDHLLDRGAAAPTPLLEPGDAGIAGVGLLGLPLLGALAELEPLVAGAVDELGAGTAPVGILLKVDAGSVATLGILGGVVEIHGWRPHNGALAVSSWVIRRSFHSLVPPSASESSLARR